MSDGTYKTLLARENSSICLGLCIHHICLEKKEEKIVNKIFDNAFRTLCERNPRLLIPIVNECFEKNYSFDEKIDLLSGEHHIMPNAENEDTKEIITDSCIRVCDKLYHIECQSNDDGTMVLRMVEYDFFIALEHAEKSEDGIYEMHFPSSSVLYLRHSDKTPDNQLMRIVFPNGKSVDYEVPIVKVQDISCEKIIKKNLYFLFPYYILRYEHLKTDDEFQKMIKEYDTLHLAMSEAYSNGFLSDYDMSNISEYAKEIIAYVAEKNQMVKKGAESIMGGIVLETYADKCIAEGRAEGRAEGESLMKQAMLLIFRDGCTTVEELIEKGIPSETARKAFEQ